MGFLLVFPTVKERSVLVPNWSQLLSQVIHVTVVNPDSSSPSTFFRPALIDSQVAPFSTRPHKSRWQPGAHTANSSALCKTISQEAPHNASGPSQSRVPINNEGRLKQQSMRDSWWGRLGLYRRLGWGFNRRPRAIIPDCRQPETQHGRRGGGVEMKELK